MAKRDGSNVQKQFLDKLATQPDAGARSSPTSSATTLNAITADDVNGPGAGRGRADRRQRHAGGHRPPRFGGDNHTDTNLQAEADQHVSGIQGIQAIDERARQRCGRAAQLTDKVTFATMNVFGRNLNGIAKVTVADRPRPLRQPRRDGDDRQERQAERHRRRDRAIERRLRRVATSTRRPAPRWPAAATSRRAQDATSRRRGRWAPRSASRRASSTATSPPARAAR